MLDLKLVLKKIFEKFKDLEAYIQEILENYYTKAETNRLLDTKQPKVIFSTEGPAQAQGEDGDIWIQYGASNIHYYIPDDLNTDDLVPGDMIICEFSGNKKQLTLPPGVYQLRCWGAQGGDVEDAQGGGGGYAGGQLTLSQSTTLYLYVGGAGLTASTSGKTVAGGFNGGGAARIGDATYPCGSGGGGTDIRIGSDSLYARVIVAGGGGGAGYKNIGGAGGGVSGIQGASSGGAPGTYGSAGIANSNTNATVAAFGVGGGNNNTATNGTMIAGGGGGWYGGAHHNASTTNTRGGGGGSGYVYNADMAIYYPDGCLLNSSYYLKDAFTADGSTIFIDPFGDMEMGHYDDGLICIFIVELS